MKNLKLLTILSIILVSLTIKLSFNNANLNKEVAELKNQRRVLLLNNKANYDRSASLDTLVSDLKNQIEIYRELIREIEQTISRECPKLNIRPSNPP